VRSYAVSLAELREFRTAASKPAFLFERGVGAPSTRSWRGRRCNVDAKVELD